MLETGLEHDSWIGPYRLVFRLGTGGMGEVWAARRPDFNEFGELIALKLVPTADLDSDEGLLFLDEARTARALRHPHVVSSFDVGRARDYFYLAMELIAGPPLRVLLQRLLDRKASISPRLVAYIGWCVSSALDYANRQATHEGRELRLIHRDISPHNILVDTLGRIKLSDFGVARTEIQKHQTRRGLIRGKPSYMSPEQITGAEIDARTDIFSLGVVLYESAILARLFAREKISETLRAIVDHEPKPLVDRVPGFPANLSKIIERMLAKDPAKRFASSGEVAQALGSCLAGSDPRALEAELAGLIERYFSAGTFDVAAQARETEREVAGASALLGPVGIGEAQTDPNLVTPPRDRVPRTIPVIDLREPQAPWYRTAVLVVLFLISCAAIGALSKRLERPRASREQAIEVVIPAVHAAQRPMHVPAIEIAPGPAETATAGAAEAETETETELAAQPAP